MQEEIKMKIKKICKGLKKLVEHEELIKRSRVVNICPWCGSFVSWDKDFNTICKCGINKYYDRIEK
jgi:hypothetical protein